MSQVTLRLPDSLHRRARSLAERDHVSLNTMIATALAEKVATLETVEMLRRRGERGKGVAFAEAFAEVPDVEPPERDRLPGDS